MKKERDIFQELGRNKKWIDFSERYAEGGTFYDIHDDILQSFIADLIEDFLKV